MSAYSALAQHYDSLTRDVAYEAVADFYEKIFELKGKRVTSILDLACGTGTLTRLLAVRGYDMTGADASEDMLSVAAEKLCGLQPSVLLLCQPMEALDLYGTVDAVVCALDGLNYVGAAKLGEVFRRVRLFLEPGGIFIFDVHKPSFLKSLDGQLFLDETPDVFCAWRADFDEKKNACHYGMDIFSRSGKAWSRSREEHTEYAHDPAILSRLLSEAGFENLTIFGDRTLHAPTDTDNRLYFVAQKPQA